MRRPGKTTGRARVFVLVLTVAFLFPSFAGWAADDCCPAAGGQGFREAVSLSPGAPAGHETDGASSEEVCPCAFCQTVRSLASIPELCSPDGAARLSAPVRSEFSSIDSSRIFRPPIA
jgi:hypothetical protein